MKSGLVWLDSGGFGGSYGGLNLKYMCVYVSFATKRGLLPKHW